MLLVVDQPARLAPCPVTVALDEGLMGSVLAELFVDGTITANVIAPRIVTTSHGRPCTQ